MVDKDYAPEIQLQPQIVRAAQVPLHAVPLAANNYKLTGTTSNYKVVNVGIKWVCPYELSYTFVLYNTVHGMCKLVYVDIDLVL